MASPSIIENIPTHEGVPVRGILRSDNCVDIGDNCTYCGRDTSPGSGLWVNRIPSGSDSADGQWELDGWMCADCQCMECDECGESVLDWTMKEQGGVICDECSIGENND